MHVSTYLSRTSWTIGKTYWRLVCVVACSCLLCGSAFFETVFTVEIMLTVEVAMKLTFEMYVLILGTLRAWNRGGEST